MIISVSLRGWSTNTDMHKHAQTLRHAKAYTDVQS